MAEVVGCMQERTIPEYELMRKYQVFTDEKIRGIVKTRENYQYKLSKNTKSLKDYGDYIIYEKKIHGMVVAIEASRKEKFPGLKQAMSNRIVRLYKEALRGFPEEVRLWEAYMKFCKSNFPSEVPNAYEKLLQKQGDRPIVWVNAAMWFHEQGNNMDKVKSIFFRGLQRHPECAALYTSFIGVLLEETATQPKEFQSASLERVTAIYNTAKKKICRVDFLINLINQCDDEKFKSFSRNLQKLVIDDMMNLYAREEKVWEFLAQRELKGISMSEFFKSFEPDADKEKEKVVKPPTLKRRIEMCYSIYQTATMTLKTKEMWAMFLNAMMELNTDLSTQRALKRKKLDLAFRAAHESKEMTSDTYYAYVNLLIETKANRDFIHSILVEATDKFSTVNLWEQRLTFHIIEDDEEKVYDAFRRATLKLGAQSYPLWKLTLQYYQTRYDDQYERLMDIFQEACERTEPQFGTFRSQYLEWSLVNQTFKATRKLYEELMKLPPPCLKLHKKMAMLEAQALKPDLSKQRQCYENAIADFGKVRSDVWIDFIKFERDEGEPKRVSNLCERAKQTLDPLYVDNFLTEFCLLSVNTSTNKNNNNKNNGTNNTSGNSSNKNENNNSTDN